MGINLKELRSKIKKARLVLMRHAKDWIDSQPKLKEHRSSWLNAIKANNSDELFKRIRKANLPLVAHTQKTDENEHMRSDRYYDLSEHQKKEQYHYELCWITNLFQQLLSLENILMPIKSIDKFSRLKLVSKKTKNMLDEWSSIDTISNKDCKEYQIRMNLLQCDLQEYRNQNDLLISEYEQAINQSKKDFSKAISCLKNFLEKMYHFQDDERSNLIFKFSSYYPWQKMAVNVLKELFGSHNYEHPKANEVKLKPSISKEYIDFYNTELNKQLKIVGTCYKSLLEKAENFLNRFKEKLNSVKDNIKFKQQSLIERSTLDNFSPFKELFKPENNFQLTFWQSLIQRRRQIPMIEDERVSNESNSNLIEFKR